MELSLTGIGLFIHLSIFILSVYNSIKFQIKAKINDIGNITPNKTKTENYILLIKFLKFILI